MKTIGKILAERQESALKRLDELVDRNRKLTEKELAELRQLTKILNIKALAAKGIAVASVAVLTGCGAASSNGLAV